MNTVSLKQWLGIPEKSDPKRWLEIRRKRFGRIFTRENRDGSGFQMLVFGHMWINVRYSGCGLESNLFNGGGIEWFDDASILWTDCGTLGFLDQ